MAKNGPSKAEIREKLVIDVKNAATDRGSPFPVRWRAWRDLSGTPHAVKNIGHRLWEKYPDIAFQSDISAYAFSLGPIDANFCVAFYECADIAKSAIAQAPSLEAMPRAFRFRGEDVDAFVELPFSPEEGFHKTWDGLMERFDNPEQTKAFIGSLFFPESYRQQYLWLSGIGGAGKGAIGRWLGKIFGGSCVTLNDIDRSDRWLHAKIGMARVVVVADFERYGFCSSGHFKSLSGGDSLYIEEKYKAGYNIVPVFKFVFLSNDLPQLSRGSEDQRRIVISSCQKAGEFDPRFEDKLWDESGAFIHSCMEAYRQACPGHGPIPKIETEGDLWATVDDDHYLDFFDEVFRKTDNTEAYITASEMAYAIRTKWPNDKSEHRRFYKWMKQNNIGYGRVKRSGVTVRYYPGLTFNPLATSWRYRDSYMDGNIRRPKPAIWEKEAQPRLVPKPEPDHHDA